MASKILGFLLLLACLAAFFMWWQLGYYKDENLTLQAKIETNKLVISNLNATLAIKERVNTELEKALTGYMGKVADIEKGAERATEEIAAAKQEADSVDPDGYMPSGLTRPFGL